MNQEEKQQVLEIFEWISKNKYSNKGLLSSPEANSSWYIISTAWIDKWQASLEKSNFDIDNLSHHPGLISNQSIIDQSPYNVTKNNYVLDPKAKFREDYLVFPKQMWTFLKKTYGFEFKIKRKAVQVFNSSPEIEIRLTRLCVFILKNSSFTTEKPYFFYFSITCLISNIVKEFKDFVEKNRTNKEIPSCRLWKLGRNCTVTELLSLVNDDSTHILFPGYRIDNKNLPLINFDFNPNDVLVFEYKEGYSRQFILKEKERVMCSECKVLVNDGGFCECHHSYFCSSICERKFHPFVTISDTTTSESSQNVDLSKQSLDSPIQKSETLNKFLIKSGLTNLGNTCYLNAGLQCLFHTKPLTTKILQGDLQSDLNLSNPIGQKGELITEYSDLLKKLLNSPSPVDPGRLKQALSNFSSQFQSFDQQDCQEMLFYLLDGIHEDLNRVLDKPQFPAPDSKNNEADLIDQYWKNHLSRNLSIIVELIHGQYKSEVECSRCKQVSTSFDPFVMLSLPVPDFSLKAVYFVLVTVEGSVMGKVIANKSARLAEVRAEISKILDIEDPESYLIAEMHEDRLLRILEESSKVRKNSTLLVYYKQVVSQDLYPEDLRLIVVSFKRKSKEKFVVVGKPHLLQIEAYLTMKELYFEVFQYMMQMRKIEVKDLVKEFDKRQPSYLKKSYLDTDEFKLIVENPFNLPCPQCFELNCRGCPIPCINELITSFFMSCKEQFLRVSVILSEKIKDTSCFEDLFFHPSCDTKLNPQPLNATLSDCFQLFSDKEQLTAINSVYCSKCKSHTISNKSFEIVKAPRILIIHLKRFKSIGNKTKKNSLPVVYPIENLDIGQYSSQTGSYDLFGIVQHTGHLQSGHYVATCKGFDNVWRTFDDSFISTPSSLFFPSAYILFYEIKNE